ncbi:anthranilate phosphoribosyltransferase [Lysinibacter cavernae]|uniref:Anthranilate phosphoribosyltransferase n=1 Tax=Lysinibacter cavernae TaxID=1640652 RepID=A0A7X5QZI8_9MICO|nr:anthranilate phosphoribosyltransferase [Lysinibacter cavernae]NIH52767.1 anthranilate phosphoribosyltransferase [Lysinibacter cavernae]
MSFSPTWPKIITSLIESNDLSVSEADWCMTQIMTGAATEAQIASFLIALRIKGETVDEVVGFRDAILDHAHSVSISPNSLDIVGTGGDRFGTVNVSTMSSIVAAAAGTPVVKHGNKAASSQSGASDVLRELGINLNLEPDQLATVFDATNIAFVFAGRFHPGFAHAGAVRQQIGVPTVFNFLGPLCNPVRPEASAVGVAQLDRVPLIVGVFQTRGANALVFRGDEGLDELSTAGHSHIWEVTRGGVTEHDLDPRDLNISKASIDDLIGQDAAYNAKVARDVLAGHDGPVRDIVLLNAAAGLVAFDLHDKPASAEIPLLDRLRTQMAVAAETIDSGAAQAKLAEWVGATQAFDSGE